VSIFVTIPATLLFWTSYFVRRGDHIPIFQWSDPKHIAGGVLCVFAFLVGFVLAGVLAFMKSSLAAQVWFLAMGALGTFILQLLAMRATWSPLETRWNTLQRSATGKIPVAKEALQILGNRDNVSKYLCFSDVPIAIAMLVLAFAVTFHPSNEQVYQEAELRSFVAGAVALQLLYSNFVFWLEALADTGRGYQLLGSLPSWLRSIQVTLRPDEEEALGGQQVVKLARRELGRLFRINTQYDATPRAEGEEPAGGETNTQTKGG